MHPLAIGLVILSAVIHAWREMLTKKAQDKQVFVWWYEIFAMIFFLPFFIYFIITEGVTLIGIGFGALTGCVHFFYWIFLSKSYEKGDLSHVYPIIRSAPALVLVLSIFFLGEQVSVQGVVGVLVILIGVYMINMKQLSLRGFLEPLRSLKDTATQYALLTALTVAIYSITDKIGVQFAHPLIFGYFITIFAFALYTPYIFYSKKRAVIVAEWKANKKMILMNGFLVKFGYLLILITLTFERVSYVTGLRQVSIVFGVLLGGHILREKHKAIRFIAAATIFAGAILISTAK